MARVFLPSALQSLIGSQDVVETFGGNVREVIADLESRFPGIRDRLCEGDDLRPSMAVMVDGGLSSLGMLQRVNAESEIHFLPYL